MIQRSQRKHPEDDVRAGYRAGDGTHRSVAAARNDDSATELERRARQFRDSAAGRSDLHLRFEAGFSEEFPDSLFQVIVPMGGAGRRVQDYRDWSLHGARQPVARAPTLRRNTKVNTSPARNPPMCAM